MLYRDVSVDFQFEDDRGVLVQLVHQGYSQVNILRTKAGVFRGGHFHKVSRELFYVLSGSVEVQLKKGDEEEKHNFSAGAFFEIQPYVLHSMTFYEDCTMVVLYDQCVECENGEKDIYPALEK